MSKRKKQKPSPIPHGSIVRTTWLDEEFNQTSEYDSLSSTGFESSGVYGVKTDGLNMLLKEGTLNDKCFFLIPHNTKGLLLVDHVWYDDSPYEDEPGFVCAWYHVIWEETSVWIHARNIVLIKKSTQ